MDFEVLGSVYQDIQLATSRLGVSMLSLCLQSGRSWQVQAISKCTDYVQKYCGRLSIYIVGDRDMGSVKVNGASSSSHKHDVSERKASMMLSYEPRAQTSSYGCMLLEIPTTPKLFCAVPLRKPPKSSLPPPKKNPGYVTMARNMPMPTPSFRFSNRTRKEGVGMGILRASSVT